MRAMGTVVPRAITFPFGPDIPRHWMYGSIFGTHLANALNLLFPLGERFFMRSVRHYLDDLEDPELRRQVQGFFGQEALHAREHERFFDQLRAQGYDLDRFLETYEKVAFELIEPNVPPVLRLSVTVALEHFTAMFAERALTEPFLDDVPAAIRDLFRWHAAEELEHKAVAFDVLKAVDPRYTVRVAGLLLATLGFVTFWLAGTRMLIAQEGEATAARILGELRRAIARKQVGHGGLAKAFVKYLRPDFHPNDLATDDLSMNYLQAIGRLSG